eukprot:165754_1
MNDTEQLAQFVSKNITTYGKSLFIDICEDPQMINVSINFSSLPVDLQNVLFINGDNNKRISLIPIVKLFPHLKFINLCGLEVQCMTSDSTDYCRAVLEYIGNSEHRGKYNVENITFQSKPEASGNHNIILKELTRTYSKRFVKHYWRFIYKFDSSSNTHQLIFTNDNT